MLLHPVLRLKDFLFLFSPSSSSSSSSYSYSSSSSLFLRINGNYDIRVYDIGNGKKKENDEYQLCRTLEYTVGKWTM